MNRLNGNLIVAVAVNGLFACASQRNIYADKFREQETSSFVYRLQAESVRSAVSALAIDWGYRAPVFDESDGLLRTNWHCNGSSCDRLEISVRPLGKDETIVAVFRKAYEEGSDTVVVETSRASDLEWALLERLDPEGAKKVAASALQRADQRMHAIAQEGGPRDE